MNDNEDRRSELRLDEQVTIFVEVCSSDATKSSAANIIICNSLDISANGIQFEMDQAVAVGSILRIGAELHNSQQALYLVGETKWVRPKEDHFSIGFELYDAENTDIAGWKELVAALIVR
jgi:hypothetical protein